jgi:hypothetical protein
MTITPKLRKAFKEIGENRSSQGKALLRAGYSKHTAKKPNQVTNSQGWQELLAIHLPDKDLAAKHKELLNKKDKNGIDTQAVKAGLDMAYKIKGYYEKDNAQKAPNIETALIKFL